MKKEILENGFKACMQTYLCGNYIDMSDVEELEYHDIEWTIDTNEYKLVAFTEFGTYAHNYDFDFNFDANLESFVEELREFLYEEINKKEI